MIERLAAALIGKKQSDPSHYLSPFSCPEICITRAQMYDVIGIFEDYPRFEIPVDTAHLKYVMHANGEGAGLQVFHSDRTLGVKLTYHNDDQTTLYNSLTVELQVIRRELVRDFILTRGRKRAHSETRRPEQGKLTYATDLAEVIALKDFILERLPVIAAAATEDQT